jgi:S-methylmethionine-dependent homocysteine/selenocysteine methylase
VSFSLEDSPAARLRSGEPIAAAVAPLLKHPHLAALLLNCCAPAAVSAALPALRAASPPALRLGVYANGFKTTTSEWLSGGRGPRLEADAADYDAATGIISPAAYARHAAAWRTAGASVVGGCCGVGPEHIAAVAAALGGRGG